MFRTKVSYSLLRGKGLHGVCTDGAAAAGRAAGLAEGNWCLIPKKKKRNRAGRGGASRLAREGQAVSTAFYQLLHVTKGDIHKGLQLCILYGSVVSS